MSDQHPQRPSAQNRTLLQSYAALPAKTRLLFSLGVCAVAAVGLVVSNYLERQLPAAPKDGQSGNNTSTSKNP